MKTFLCLLLLFWLLSPAARAQTTGSVGIGTTTPNPAAVLDVSSSGKGLLIPRLDSAQRAGITAPPDGLMVFQTDGRKGFWYAVGGQWVYIPDKTRSGDNLGNHRATQNLNLGLHLLTGDGPGGLRMLPVDSATATVQTQPLLHLIRPTTTGAKWPNELQIGLGSYGTSTFSQTRADFILSDFTTPATTVMSMLADGRVGINTTQPRAALEVNNTWSTFYTDALYVEAPTYRVAKLASSDSGPHLTLAQTGTGGGQALVDYIGAFATSDYRAGALELRGYNSVQISGDNDTAPDVTVLANGNVGVGTTAPAARLHARSSDINVATFEADGAGPHLTLAKPGVAGQATIDYIGVGVTNSYRDGALELRGNNAVHLSADGDTSPELAVRANGNVGIGTADPQQRLHVTGQVYSSAGGFRFPDNTVQTTAAAGDNLGNHTARQNLNLRRNLLTGGGPAGLALDSVGLATATVQTQPLLRLVRPTTPFAKWPNQLQIGLGSYGTAAESQTRADFTLIDGASTTPDRTVLSLLANGRVGINTTTPQNPLHVVAPGTDAATLESGAAGPHLNLLKTGTAGQATIDYIGAGVTNSYRDGALELRGNTAVQISGNNDTTPELTIKADGKVGVGTADPQATLDVNGSVRLGPLGTVMRNVQSGIVNVGPNTNNTALVGLNFPHAFGATPLVLVSVTAEDNTSLWDVYSASVRVVSANQLYINVRRVDTTTGGWTQNLRLTWMAWEQ